VPAEIAGQRVLLQRAAAGDREAFGRLYDAQVEGVYRYLLAWTGDRAAAADLTRQVFAAALSWLPVTAGGEGEAGAWLVAMARDAVAQRRGSGWIAGPAGPDGGTRPGHEGGAAAGDVLATLARLGDPEREVVVLRLLLGHSLAHTAHLSGYSRRAVLELQLAACLAIRDLTGGAGPSPRREAVSAAEFERRLGRWGIDLTGGDPALDDALAVAGSLRRAIAGYVVAPQDAFVRRLRAELVAAAPGGPSPGPDRTPPPPARAKAAGSRSWLSRRPWLATSIATAGIVTVLALQAFGDPGPPLTCDGRPCPPPTTVAAAGGGLATPLSTDPEPSTTSSTAASSSTPTTAAPASAPASAVTAPPATAPATTVTRPTRPTTSRPPRRTTTTAPTTTAQQATTTTGPPPTPSP
jgi:DNA-directed RNA polymerase specialized sigma24 family protein